MKGYPWIENRTQWDYHRADDEGRDYRRRLMQRSSPCYMFWHLQSDYHHNYFSLKCFFLCLVHFTKCVQPLWTKSDTAIELIEYRVQSHWLVAQSEVICSQKPGSAWSSLFTMWMGDRYMLGFAPTLIPLESNSLQTLQKLFGWHKLRSPVYTSMQKYHICMLKIL